MTIYKNTREVIEISLPSLPDSKIKLYSKLTYGDTEDIYAKKGNDMQKSIEMLLLVIKDWNLTDEQNVKLSITKETIRNFEVSDVLFLLEKLDLSFEKIKKKANFQK